MCKNCTLSEAPKSLGPVPALTVGLPRFGRGRVSLASGSKTRRRKFGVSGSDAYFAELELSSNANFDRLEAHSGSTRKLELGSGSKKIRLVPLLVSPEKTSASARAHSRRPDSSLFCRNAA